MRCSELATAEERVAEGKRIVVTDALMAGVYASKLEQEAG
jgi:hypothetical protein